MLAPSLAESRTNTVIPCIYSPEGTLYTYCSLLYSPIPLQIPALPISVSTQLDAPFMTEELAAAIGAFPNGKSLGPNGMSAEWYKQYLEFLTLRMLRLYVECLEAESLPTSF